MSKPEMVTLTGDAAREFLSRKGNRHTGVHQWKPLKRIPWPYCTNCGLLLLKNDVTRRAAKAACVYYDD